MLPLQGGMDSILGQGTKNMHIAWCSQKKKRKKERKEKQNNTLADGKKCFININRKPYHEGYLIFVFNDAPGPSDPSSLRISLSLPSSSLPLFWAVDWGAEKIQTF